MESRKLFNVTGRDARVAYFSMEVGLNTEIPTYSGGLGVLAGDTLRAAADLEVPMVGITLLHRKGYFRQHLDASGFQSETEVEWSPDALLEPLQARAELEVEGRSVLVGAWRHIITGVTGHYVPVYFLDTDLPDNDPLDRALTDHLYGGDQRYRLCQEIVLGMGGVAMLRALGYAQIQTHHMNEGHSALLALALLDEQTGGRPSDAADLQAVRNRCVFTTHTPVPAGHDQFPMDLVSSVLGNRWAAVARVASETSNGVLNMTHLALASSRYVNGVAIRHGEVSREMFPGYRISSITNGVHALTWTAQPFRDLFDRRLPGWRPNNGFLKHAEGIETAEIEAAHAECKRALIADVHARTGIQLEQERLTIGFARRATAYKRADLLFTDLERLQSIATARGALQVIYAGKAHPRDEAGKEMIRRVFEAAAALRGSVRVVYLEDYDMDIAARLCAGVDVWLNNPQKPHEASGTSGMKCALNGVPSLSVVDGWWVEGLVEGITGWAIEAAGEGDTDAAEAAALYGKLENVVIPMFYERPEEYAAIRRSAIALNGSYFNTERMMYQYVTEAYRMGTPVREGTMAEITPPSLAAGM